MQQFKRDIFFLLQIQKNWGRKKKYIYVYLVMSMVYRMIEQIHELNQIVLMMVVLKQQ
jgi:hypothetical protein